MPDRPECIPASLVGAEARASAHQLRAIAARLLAMAQLLPLPPQEVLDQLLEEASEQAFKDFPLLSLFVDLETLVRDRLLPTAEALEEAANVA